VFNLAWRPGERATGEEVDVQVGDGFSAVGAVVHHEAEAVSELEFFR
jgi:hypothetical protein